jgi:hypothetical protein
MRGILWNAGTAPPSAGNGSAMRAGSVALLCFGCSDDSVRCDPARVIGRVELATINCAQNQLAGD